MLGLFVILTFINIISWRKMKNVYDVSLAHCHQSIICNGTLKSSMNFAHLFDPLGSSQVLLTCVMLYFWRIWDSITAKEMHQYKDRVRYGAWYYRVQEVWQFIRMFSQTETQSIETHILVRASLCLISSILSILSKIAPPISK